MSWKRPAASPDLASRDSRGRAKRHQAASAKETSGVDTAPAHHANDSKEGVDALEGLMQLATAQIERLFVGEVGSAKKRIKEVLESMSNNGVLKYASMCSGTDVAFCCTEAVARVVDAKIAVENLFCCELDAAKQDFLLTAHKPECLYVDINDMKQLSASCKKHGTSCPIPSSRTGSNRAGPQFVTAGFSCKTLSPLNMARSTEARDCLHDKVGSTGNTYSALIEYLRVHVAPLLILENVPEILNPKNTNLATMLQDLWRMGYICESYEANASVQGSCVVRRRAYFMVLHVASWNVSKTDGQQMLRAARLLLQGVNMEPVKTLLATLLPDNDPLVQQELTARSTKSTFTHADAKWTAQHLQMKTEQGIATSALSLPESVTRSSCYHTLTPREREILAWAWNQNDGQAPAYELSQSMGRGSTKVEKSQGLLSTALLPGSLIWLTQRNRILTGAEGLLLQHVPKQLFENQPNRRIFMSLAGNAFNAASFMITMLALLGHLPKMGTGAGEGPVEAIVEHSDEARVHARAIVDAAATLYEAVEVEASAEDKSAETRIRAGTVMDATEMLYGAADSSESD
mmetsp:Transcript_45615/g.102382  ORF Transcript_45615/g.102382 Transcript_45615/m.102382 type:complete len:575 (-) Transcript_45615:5-1729(-)